MSVKILDLAAQWTGTEPMEENRRSGDLYLFAKRAADILCSLTAIIVLSPVFLAIAAAIRFSSRGPVIYSHRRVGYHGGMIPVYKFRTMVQDADNLQKYLTAEEIAQFRKNYKLENDPRVTGIGRILRKTSLDELPQLFNILAGQMSLVGPRPITQEELEKYGFSADLYLSVKPGLTGMWQVNGRSSKSYEERVLLDVNYIRSKSLRLDIRLILQTVMVVVTHKGAF